MNKLDHLVVDIETIPNPDVDTSTFVDGRTPTVPCHCVVAISMMRITRDRCHYIRSIGEPDDEESDLVLKFVKGIHDKNFDSVFVTWGGRFFDFPVLLWRAMYYGITAPRLHSAIGKRFDSHIHVDLADQMAYYGSTIKYKMLHAAQALGMPGKTDLDGAGVEAAFDEGRILDIRKHCCMDVLQEGIIFLRWLCVRGELSVLSYNGLLRSVLERGKALELDVEGWESRLIIET